MPPSPGLFHLYIPLFSTHIPTCILDIRRKLPSYTRLVRSFTHPHTYHTGISTEHFSRSQGSPPPPKPTFQLQLPEQPQVLRYTNLYLPPHHPHHTYHILNWKLNWHNNPLTPPVSHPLTNPPHRYPDPGFSTSFAQTTTYIHTHIGTITTQTCQPNSLLP